MTSRDGIESGVAPLDLEALDWVVRLTVGRLSESDREAFETWRATSEDHDRAFEAASALGAYVRRIPLAIGPDSFGDADDAEAGDDGKVIPFAPAAARRSVSRRAFIGGGGAIAASIAGGLMMTNPPLGLWPSLSELMADERTGAGERRQFTPMAGIEVELNSRSSASRIDGGRGLDLVTGEAFIRVAGENTPFRVHAGGGTVLARRAEFNVQALADELCVTCISGSVDIERGARSERLGAGRELRFAANGALSEARADPMVRLAWRRGLLILRGTPVSEAIPQINRYYPGRLVLNDSSKGGVPVTGTFHIEQIGLAVVQLERLLGVSATRYPGGIVLLG